MPRSRLRSLWPVSQRPDQDLDAKQSHRWLVGVRRAAALAIIVFTVAVAFGGFLETCHDEVVGETADVVRVCEDSAVAEPRYVLALVVALLLLWPDLSEFSVGGISLKRRVERAEEAQQSLQHEVVQLRQSFNFQQRVEVPVYINFDDPALADPLPDRERPEITSEPQAPPDTATQALVVLRTYEALRFFDIRAGQVPDTVDVFKDGGQTQIDHWRTEVARHWPEAVGLPVATLAEQAYVFSNNFPDHLRAIRAIRNAIAHGQPVQEDDLLRAYDIALILRSWLVDRFEAHREGFQNLDPDERMHVGPLVQESDA